jgi:hypothetical protein
VSHPVTIAVHVDRLRHAMVSGPFPRAPFPYRYLLPPDEWWRLREDVTELARRMGLVGPVALESVPEQHFLFMGIPVVPAPIGEGEWHILMRADAA